MKSDVERYIKNYLEYAKGKLDRQLRIGRY